MDDLSLVPTEDLVEELFDRYDLGVICLFQEKSDERTSTDLYSIGDALGCLGLCEYTKHFIMQKYIETETERLE